MYVRIYYTGGFIEWTSISMMKATGFGTNCKEIIISLVLSYQPKKKDLLAFGGSDTNAI